MFWRYNALSSNLDTLLERESVTLHELMDEDDILQECKGQNNKLLEFLVTPKVMDELVKLITCEPNEDVEDKVRYKYPNIACELLTSDVSQILEKLVEDNVLIDKVYAFMQSSHSLNPLLASFFTKVMGLLLVRKADYLFDYLRAKEDFLGNLLSHIGTSAIMDLLMRLVSYDPQYETKSKVLAWMDDECLIEKLVGLLHADYSEDVHYNAAATLCDIVRFGREQMGAELPPSDPLLEKLESESVLTKLISNMLDGGRSESVITNALLILQTILEYRRQISPFDDWRPLPEGCGGDPLPQQELDRMDRAVGAVLNCVKPRLAEITELLVVPPQECGSMKTTVGTLEPPLGYTRLQVAKLFSSLFAIDDNALHVCLVQHDVINKLLDLFFAYVWNNFLHAQVEMSIDNILSRRYEEESRTAVMGVASEEQSPLITHLFKDCRILDRICEAWSVNDECQIAGRQRRGYMGHLTKICNDLVASASKGPYSTLIQSLLKDLPEETTAKWAELVESGLADTNKRNTTDLVGGHQLNSSSGSDSDSDFKDIPFPQDDNMQQAFSDYQMQQLTSNFIDQFGLNEEEFGESNHRLDAAFGEETTSSDWKNYADEVEDKQCQSVCEMRATRFDADDDEDDEDELWQEKEITFSKPSPQILSNAAMVDSDSDSSEDELSSPAVIRSKADDQPMEIDNPLADVKAGVTEVAMDTSPWETQATAAGGQDEEWTAFESSAEADDSSAGWADFTNLEEARVDDGGPRASSPGELIDMASSPAKMASVGTNTRTDVTASSPPRLTSDFDDNESAAGEGSESDVATGADSIQTLSQLASEKLAKASLAITTTNHTVDAPNVTTSDSITNESGAAAGTTETVAETDSMTAVPASIKMEVDEEVKAPTIVSSPDEASPQSSPLPARTEESHEEPATPDDDKLSAPTIPPQVSETGEDSSAAGDSTLSPKLSDDKLVNGPSTVPPSEVTNGPSG